jgi:scyllo-inositol 2-dehydrogenase (NADP+)
LDGSEGVYTIVDEKGSKENSYFTALKGNYTRLFDAVYDQVRKNEPYPVKEEEIIWQLEILESRDIRD